jgi:hypothetical protein
MRSHYLSGTIERLDLWPLLLRCLPHVVVGLQLVPDLSVGSQGCGKAQRHIGRDTCLAIEYAGKRSARNLQMLGGLRYVDIAQKFPEHFTGVRRVVHTHRVSFLVIILIVNENHVLAFECKR